MAIERQDGGEPRSGASENHVFRAASPECVTGGDAEGYAIKGTPLPDPLPS